MEGASSNVIKSWRETDDADAEVVAGERYGKEEREGKEEEDDAGTGGLGALSIVELLSQVGMKSTDLSVDTRSVSSLHNRVKEL